MKIRKLACGHKIIDPEKGIKVYLPILINHVLNCEKAQIIMRESRKINNEK